MPFTRMGELTREPRKLDSLAKAEAGLPEPAPRRPRRALPLAVEWRRAVGVPLAALVGVAAALARLRCGDRSSAPCVPTVLVLW